MEPAALQALTSLLPHSSGTGASPAIINPTSTGYIASSGQAINRFGRGYINSRTSETFMPNGSGGSIGSGGVQFRHLGNTLRNMTTGNDYHKIPGGLIDSDGKTMVSLGPGVVSNMTSGLGRKL